MKTTTAWGQSSVPTLFVGMELSDKIWKLALSSGWGQRPRLRDVAAGDLERLAEEIRRALKRFGLAPDTPVWLCYEAGRYGFWVHRALEARGWRCLVVDSSSIEVSRRRRRAKTDRLDASKLGSQLARYGQGEKPALKVVRVPSEAEEDRRHWHRELKTLKADRSRISARLRSLLQLQGIRWGGSLQGLGERLESLRDWAGRPLPAVLLGRLERETRRWEELSRSIAELDQARREWARGQDHPVWQMVCHLMRVKGIGIETAWYLTLELFGWRRFANRRQLAGVAGICPTPFGTGGEFRERGISQASNSQLRAILIEMAWSWVRYQPTSALTLWWKRRFSEGGGRARKIGIVALARKLLIQLWKYVKWGEIPQGASLKPLKA